MASRSWTKKEIQGCLSIMKKCEDINVAKALIWKKYQRSYDSFTGALTRFGYTESPSSYLKKIKITELTDKDFEKKIQEDLFIKKLEDERDQYRALCDKLTQDRITGEALKNIIHEIAGFKPQPRPAWTVKDRKVSQNGTPVLLISDVHWDETVSPEQVNNLNEFSMSIQQKRMDYTFKKATDLLMNHFSKPDYDGLKLCINGDLMSGNIHEELRETNARPILKSTQAVIETLVDNITALSESFKFIDIDFQVGNHGRMDRKPRAKNGVIDNYEWMIAQAVAKHFSKSGKITVHVPDSFETVFELYGRRYLLTHGDAFTGGAGIGGILVPILRGFAKKQANYAKVGKPVDVMMIGHFHQYHAMPYLIINGSMKGYDEYAMKGSFPFEKPMQSLHIEHPDRGMIFFTPIHCDGYLKK